MSDGEHILYDKGLVGHDSQRDFLLVPQRGVNGDDRLEALSRVLSSGRIVIENAFARLKLLFALFRYYTLSRSESYYL